MTRAITPASYEASAVALATTMLAACAAWQAAVGAADADGAKACIVESWGGDPRQNLAEGTMANALGEPVPLTGPLAIVDLRALEPTLAGIGEWDRRGEVRVYVEAPVGDQETPPDVMARLRNLLGNLRAQLEAQVGTAAGFAVAEISTAGPWISEHGEDDQAGANSPVRRGEIELTITFYG